MVKVKVKNKSQNSIFFYAIIIVGIIAIFFFKTGKLNNTNSSYKKETIFDKPENELSIEEWKKIADIRAEEFSECTAGLAKDLESLSIYENCYRNYNNQWVIFQIGLDEKANLNFEQREVIKDYWNQKEDETRERVIKLMDENEKRLRPNKYE